MSNYSSPESTRRGLFIVFEGGDGAGKSTQVQLLADALRRQGRKVLCTREPGGTPIGEAIREILLTQQGLTDRAEALLFAAARTQHVEQVIAPALADGVHVIADRFLDSSLAYQGGGRGLSVAAVNEINRWGFGELTPDMTFLLDLDVATARQRLSSRNEGGDRIEAEVEEFHQQLRTTFLQLAAAEPHRYCVLDAGVCAEQLHKQVLARLAELPGSQQPTPFIAGNTAQPNTVGSNSISGNEQGAR